MRSARASRFLVLVTLGLAALLVSWWAARDTAAIPSWEATLTTQLNGWPGWFIWPLWPVMQAGSAWMVAAMPVALGLWQRRWAAVGAAALGLLAAWGLARVAKEVAGRGRPTDFLDGIQVREAGLHGYGFPSGHAAVAFAAAVIICAYLPARWRAFPLAVAVVTAISRVYVGAHLPLDVVGGAGLGFLCGAVALRLFQEPPCEQRVLLDASNSA